MIDSWKGPDKFKHLIGSMVMVFVLYAIFKVSGLFAGGNIKALSFMLSVSIGIGKEYLCDTDPSYKDIVADIIGSSAIFLI